MKEIYISIDVETTGPNLFKNSMVNLGAIAIDMDKRIHSYFDGYIQEDGQIRNQDTWNSFWIPNQKVWNYIEQRMESPYAVMPRFKTWLDDFASQGYTPIVVAFPGSFDYPWIKYYLDKYADDGTRNNPFLLDMKTFSYATLKTTWNKTSKRHWPKNWFEKDVPHNHLALSDSTEQGIIFANMLRHNLGLSPIGVQWCSGLRQTIDSMKIDVK